MNIQIFLAALMAVIVSACLGDEIEDATAQIEAEQHEEGIPAAEACEHYEAGPFVDVVAVTSTTATTIPAVNNDHTSYEVALSEVTSAGGFVGTIKFEVAEASDYIFLFDEDVQARFYQSDGTTEIDPETELEGADECALVVVQVIIELPVGTAIIELQSDTIDLVSLVIEEASHEHDDEEM